MTEAFSIFLSKAQECLAGAESEFANGRYNNCANRCYYGCFQAAIFALSQAGIRPPEGRGQWSHSFVPAHFDGELINRRKLYSRELRNVLARTYALRGIADYKEDLVSPVEASRALRRTRSLLEAVLARRGETP